MNKIVLALLGITLLVGLAACSAAPAVNTDPAEVSRAANNIADFDLPLDYQPEFSASLAGYTMAAFNPGDGHSHLYLIQSQKEADGEMLAKSLQEFVPGLSDSYTRMTVIETLPVSVRGQDTTLIISENTNSEGELYRQAMAAFQGKGGPALLVLSEPVDRYDQAAVDAFLASIQ